MTFVDLFRQFSLLVALPAMLLAGASAVLIVVVRDWRVVLFSYALFTVMLTLLFAQVVPVEWALLQAIVGGLIAVMIFLSASQLRGRWGNGLAWEARWPQVASLSSFRAMAAALAAVAFFAVRDSVVLPKVEPLLRDVILWLTIIGILGLALHDEPLHAGLALLMVLGGGQLFLFSLVQRRMLVGLADAGQLLLGLAISYLILSRGLATGDLKSDPPASRWQL
jgi:hypothetical protein